MPNVQLAGPLLEGDAMSEHAHPAPPMDTGEPMIDARQSAVSLCLPYYWFADRTMRAKHRIPHYLLGGLVRFRQSELAAWAASQSAPKGRQTPPVETAEDGAA